MQHLKLRRLAWVCLGAWVMAGPAAAQAPIVYAAQGETGVASGLAGGGDTSYGYGGANGARSGAVIDIRRAGALTQVDAASTQTAEQGTTRPGWLEQERVGPPYEADGRWYVPTAEPGYEQTGVASWYGREFHGQRTASGERFDQHALTAAHPTLPIPSLVQVTNLENGREVIVRVNDRGPFVGRRVIDVSRAAADVLGFADAGRARVHVRYLGPAPRRVATNGAPAATPLQEPAGEEGPPSLLPPPPARVTEVSLEGGPSAAAPAGPAPVARAGGYVIQVGAYADLSNAHRVRDAVGPAGPVLVDVRDTANGELFRVRVGPWPSRAEAEAARQTLATLGYPDAVVAVR